jgi:predicted GNAT family N-acyltransferase
MIEIAPYQSSLYKQSLVLRDEVLRKPLGLSLESIDTKEDANHIHFVAKEGEEVVGVVVLVPNYKPHVGKLRQMATIEKVRGKGYGIELVKALEDYAAENGMVEIVLHARHYAVGFYEKIGYEICSEVFQEVGIDHYKMRKDIITG